MHRAPIAALALACAIGCAAPKQPATFETRAQRVVDGKIADVVSKQERGRNVIISPYGLRQLFGMLALGAEGEARTRMIAALALDTRASERDPIVRPGLTVRNALWIDAKYRPSGSFLSAVRSGFGADVYRPDFRADETVPAIEDWVTNATGGLIASVPVRQGTTFVGIDALTYRVSWLDPFQIARTTQGPFHTSRGAVLVPFMHRSTEANYYEDAVAQYLELPLADGNLIVFGLPNGSIRPTTLRHTIAAYEDASFVAASVQIVVPRFAVTSFVDMTSSLESGGMEAAPPTGRGTFAPIFGENGPGIDLIYQQGSFTVDEGGVKVAVVSVAAAIEKVNVAPRRHVVFRADRPFAFAIEDTRTATLLAAGIVERP